LLHGKPNDREGEGAPGARGSTPDRTGLGRVGRGPRRKPTTRTTANRNPKANQKPETRRDGCAIKHNIKQKVCFGMMLHPWQLKFFLFTHNMDTSHYTPLKVGGRGETGREKRVTPEFGEYQRRKILPPNSGRYNSPRQCLRVRSTQARWDTWLVGKVVPPLQSVKLICQSCSRLRATWTLT
jgi:hypothetical protein